VATWVYDTLTKDWFQWRTGTNEYHQLITHTLISTASTRINLVGTNNVNMSGPSAIFYLDSTYYLDDTVTANSVIYRERTTNHVENQQERISIASIMLDCEEGVAVQEGSSTTIATAVVGGETSIVVAATPGGTTAGDTVQVLMDDYTYFYATLTNVAGTTLTFANQPIPGSAAIGQQVKVYQDAAYTMEWSKDGGHTFGSAITRFFGGTELGSWGATNMFRAVIYGLGQARQWTFRFKTTARNKVVIKGLIARLWGEEGK
jgi:hypothetical protein